MRTRVGSAAVLLVALCAAAQAADVGHSRLAGTDFSSYETFAWAPKPHLNPKAPLADGSPLDRLIKETAEKVLADRGLRRVKRSEAELLIQFVGLVRDVTSIEGTKYDAGRIAWIGDPTSHSVRSYQEGTLVFEVVDLAQDQMVWSGWMSDVARDTEKLAKKAPKAVRKILSHYPAGR